MGADSLNLHADVIFRSQKHTAIQLSTAATKNRLGKYRHFNVSSSQFFLYIIFEN